MAKKGKKNEFSEDGVKILSVNRKARFNYIVEETLECGIELKGTEVKSLRNGKFSFSDSYAIVNKLELWLIQFHISPYDFGNIHNHDADRNRKLLAHKQEIKRLSRRIDEKGITLVPLRLYLKNSKIKVEIGLCKGKNVQDKRNTIKERDEKRSVEREFRQRF
ncbi:MAG: SsrA-binding protein SmpB [Spirochaetales bacterium]|nr:SsrA-binding protein SmpB [Spirochaetales bacterium]